MSYKINFETYANHFVLPQDILDKDIDTLNPDYLKVILVIFRNCDKHYSPNLLSNLLNIEEKRVKEAIQYWIDRGTLLATKDVPQISKPIVLSKQASPISNVSTQETKYLLDCMEAILARPITSAEHQSVVHILEFIKLPADVVLMAIEYCVSIHKLSPKYLEKVCASWADNGINSHELAEKYLTMLSTLKSAEHQIQKIFGIENRNLIESEQAYIRTWLFEFHFNLDMIKLAYEKTITAIGKLAFPYLNKILSSWHEKGYKVIDDVANEGIPKNTVKSNKKTSYDIDELDRFWNNVPKLND